MTSAKCPIDPAAISRSLRSFNAMTSLPWVPYYTQSGGEASPGGADAAAVDPLRYWAVALTVAFTVFVYCFEGHLDGRQKGSYGGDEFPAQLAETVGKIDEEAKKGGGANKGDDDDGKKDEKKDGKEEGGEEDAAARKAKVDRAAPLLPQLKSKFSSAQSYGLDKVNFSMISSAYDTFETVAFILLGFAPYMWDKSAEFGAGRFGWDETEDEIKVTLIFLVVTTLMGTVTGLPFELYSTFCIEKKHGFNKQTPKLFFTDKIKSLFLTFLIGGPFIALLLRIIKWGGDQFYIYVWAFMFCFSVFMMTIVPVLIMPLFNKYEPLKDRELKTQIYALADRLKYPLTKLFVMDGSKRSSHSNAFMFGFGNNKRIVLFDTLMEQVHDDEILAILGHELGHWKLGHTLSNFVITQLYFGAAFYCFSLCYTSEDLYAAFGFDGPGRPTPTVIALMLFFQTLWAPVDKILSFILTVFSRHNEFAADRFSVELGMSARLQSGLCKIHLENLGAMAPDPWYSTYHYSHPPLVERLGAMMALDKKSK